MRKRPLFFIGCVFLAGLACERYHAPEIGFFLVGLLLLEGYHGFISHHYKRAAGRSIILLSAFFIGMNHMYQEEQFRDTYLSKIEGGETAVVWGEIIKIEETNTYFRLILSDCYISLKEEQIPCNKVMVYSLSDHYHVGEIHKITGELNNFERPRNEGGFDSLEFYQSQKIDFYLYEKESELLAEEGSWIKRCLLSLSQGMKKVFDAGLNEKSAGFFVGMILGDKSELDARLKDLFTVGGISHILAISGLHVSMIGRGLYQWLRKRGLSFFAAGSFGAAVLCGYAYMVGAGMSTARAVGMMLLSFFAQYLGRSYDLLNGLGAMALFLLWENPFLLEYSGFWFSMMSLIGVAFVGPALTKGSGLGMGLGITLSTLPVVAWCYFEIPLYSVLVNAIVLPILTPLFALGLFAGLIGVVFMPIAKLLLIPCGWGLAFYEALCTFVETLPGATILCGKPKLWIVFLYYALLFSLCWWSKNKDKNRKCKWLLLLCISLLLYPKPKPTEITFLDVGQGDGIYVGGGDGVSFFIDGGSTNVNQVGEYRILPFLKSRGIGGIDYWFISHADSDHISGLIEVLESGYPVDHLVFASGAPRDEALVSLLELAEKEKVTVIFMKVGDELRSSGTVWKCISSGGESTGDENAGDKTTEDKNDASLVLELTFIEEDGFSALFAGDISEKVEARLCQKLRDVDLLKANHHGSNYSNGDELLEVTKPERVVVSCSRYNRYGHPGKKAVERFLDAGAEIYYTMDSGQISFTWKSSDFLIKCHYENN